MIDTIRIGKLERWKGVAKERRSTAVAGNDKDSGVVVKASG